MKLLAFDCEFATCKNNNYIICEFGYVLFDENFKESEKNNFIINPEIKSSEWDWWVLKNLLNRQKEDYANGLCFEAYYPKIKQLIDESDYIVGCSIKNDIHGLRDACDRYNIDHISSFKYFDVNDLYDILYPNEETLCLKKMFDKYYRPYAGEHDAKNDAVMTMYVFKKFLSLIGKPLDELYSNISKLKLESSLNRDISHKRISSYVDALNSNIKDGLFDRKKYCPSLLLQKKDRIKFLNLITFINNNGGLIDLKASVADVFIKCDYKDAKTGEALIDKRFESALDYSLTNSNYLIISLEDFMNKYNLDDSILNDNSITRKVNELLLNLQGDL